MDGPARRQGLLAAVEKSCRKRVAADAWAGRDVDRQPGAALLGQEDEMLREWYWAEARDSRSATEAAPELKVDEWPEFPRVTERQVQPPPDAREWAAAEVPKALARTGAWQPARMRSVGWLARLDELVSEKQPAAARQASRHVTRQQETQQRLKVKPGPPQPVAQVLPQAEQPQQAAQLQEP